MKRRNVRTLGLVVATFTYLLIGAAVFDALEGPHNENAYEALTKIKIDVMNKYNMTEEDYKLMELLMIERKPHKNGPQWKFAGKQNLLFLHIFVVEKRMSNLELCFFTREYT
jgi:potassium channel subfamily K protein 9